MFEGQTCVAGSGQARRALVLSGHRATADRGHRVCAARLEHEPGHGPSAESGQAMDAGLVLPTCRATKSAPLAAMLELPYDLSGQADAADSGQLPDAALLHEAGQRRSADSGQLARAGLVHYQRQERHDV